MAPEKTVIGAFATPAEADRAKLLLVQAGVAETAIALSTDLAADALAAECPGQTYVNQPGQSTGRELMMAGADTAHVGACVLRVELETNAKRGAVESIMRECGAHQAPCPQ